MDPIQVPIGPVTRARAKKFKETFNAFGLRRVRGGPKEMIKVLFKIGCLWFKRWSENRGQKT